jgi:putative transposase
MYRVLGVSRSGFYAWRGRQSAPPPARQMANQHLTAAIGEVFTKSRQTYGAPRMHAALRAAGYSCRRGRVARLMKSAGFAAQRKRKRTVTTDSNHDQLVAANVLDRQFSASRPDEKWLTDMMSLATGEGGLYLAGVLDGYSRRVVGWALEKTMSQELVAQALPMAISGRRPAAGLLHHSDRGSQYAAGDYQQLMSKHEMRLSMSRRANGRANALMEAFWATLKAEWAGVVCAARAEARRVICEYIEVGYNRARRHSARGYGRPAACEQLYYQALAVSTETE